MDIVAWRKSKGWSQSDLARRLGLRSKGQVSDIERGAERPSTDLAIELDRLSMGACSVRELRPDLHDVRVIQPVQDPQVSA